MHIYYFLMDLSFSESKARMKKLIEYEIITPGK